MSNLEERFFSLSPDQQHKVHFLLARHALSLWKAYTRDPEEIRYVESVVGTLQVVDKRLPPDALASARAGQDLASVAERYREPVAALQDGDLTFPERIEFAYYALYNLFRKYALHHEIDGWLIVNQALASEEEADQWSPLLQAIEQAVQEGG